MNFFCKGLAVHFFFFEYLLLILNFALDKVMNKWVWLGSKRTLFMEA